MVGFISFVTLAIALAAPVTAFPAHVSLAGLSREELDMAMSGFGPYSTPPPPPGPLEFGGTKLVNDAEHPFMDPKDTDIRGPCPALNTLANHGVCIFRANLSQKSNLTVIHSTSTVMVLTLRQTSSVPPWKVCLFRPFLSYLIAEFVQASTCTTTWPSSPAIPPSL